MIEYKALIEAYECHSKSDEHKENMMDVICKLLAGQSPDAKDIAVIIQGFAMQPTLCTLDLQELIDTINKQYNTNYTIKE